jgi:hypothetical protein
MTERVPDDRDHADYSQMNTDERLLDRRPLDRAVRNAPGTAELRSDGEWPR